MSNQLTFFLKKMIILNIEGLCSFKNDLKLKNKLGGKTFDDEIKECLFFIFHYIVLNYH